MSSQTVQNVLGSDTVSVCMCAFVTFAPFELQKYILITNRLESLEHSFMYANNVETLSLATLVFLFPLLLLAFKILNAICSAWRPDVFSLSLQIYSLLREAYRYDHISRLFCPLYLGGFSQ